MWPADTTVLGVIAGSGSGAGGRAGQGRTGVGAGRLHPSPPESWFSDVLHHTARRVALIKVSDGRCCAVGASAAARSRRTGKRGGWDQCRDTFAHARYRESVTWRLARQCLVGRDWTGSRCPSLLLARRSGRVKRTTMNTLDGLIKLNYLTLGPPEVHFKFYDAFMYNIL